MSPPNTSGCEACIKGAKQQGIRTGTHWDLVDPLRVLSSFDRHRSLLLDQKCKWRTLWIGRTPTWSRPEPRDICPAPKDAPPLILRLYHRHHKETWFCTPQTCKEENSEAFAGRHAATSTSFYI